MNPRTRRRVLVGAGAGLVAAALGVRLRFEQRDTRGSFDHYAEWQSAEREFAIGDRVEAGALRLPTLDGDVADLADFAGRPLILTFWASWCGPCLIELRMLRDAAARLDAAGIGVVTVAIDIAANLRTLVAGERFGFPVLVAGEAGENPMSLFGRREVAVPFGVLFDRELRVVATHAGALDAAGLDRAIAQLAPAAR